jgi:MGT family glycosyltransferase
MANILMGTMGFTGHINAGLPIARKLVERGNKVWWYSGQKFQHKIEATGASFIRMTAGYDFDDFHLDEAFPEQANLNGLASMKAFIKQVLIDTIPGYLTDLEAIIPWVQPDVMMVDHLFAAAVPFHARTAVPWATFSVSPLTLSSRDTAPDSLALLPNHSLLGEMRNRALYFLFNKIILRDVNAYADQQMVRLGAEPTGRSVFETTLSPFLYLQPTVEAFEYPRRDLPHQVHFIGPFLPGSSKDFFPFGWWQEMVNSPRPVVHVTQGTLATESDQLIVPTVKALADEDVMVIVTTGGKSLDTLKIDELPANVKVESFIPHYHLLPHVSIMVTNGGYGGVQIALANGVPLVVAGATEDKAEVANRVLWSGTGINLKTNTPTEEQIREGVRKILVESSYREKAKAMQADMQNSDSATEGSILIERLAQTRKPVLRGQFVPVVEMETRLKDWAI